jgi:ATP-dependent exoDNAse (exonuclease V) beta subunit
MNLSIKNAHPLDKNIQFMEIGHKYSILSDPSSQYISVTTWNHSHFPKFDADKIIQKMIKGKGYKEGHKYWGLTAEEIKQQWSSNSAAQEGTDLHYAIECFMNNPNILPNYTHSDLYKQYILLHPQFKETTAIEWQYFIQFVQDHPNLKPYRTEWVIYDEKYKIAGSIDMVYENEDGSLSIYDWKRCKQISRINQYNQYAITSSICHLPDANFWHYALQLNTYKSIIERNYGKIVKDLILVRLHPESEEKTYELIELPNLNKEIIDLLIEK